MFGYCTTYKGAFLCDTGERLGKIAAENDHIDCKHHQQEVDKEAEQDAQLDGASDVPRDKIVREKRHRQRNRRDCNGVGPRIQHPTWIIESQFSYRKIQHQSSKRGDEHIKWPCAFRLAGLRLDRWCFYGIHRMKYST